MNINFKKLLSNSKRFVLDRKNSLSLPSIDLRPQTADRQRINALFKLRDKIFFKKKKPFSEAYPFTVIDPFDVFGEENLFGDFNLVGDDWRDKNSDKPVALLWGFNNWKWGFVSDYLPEYRTAFAPRKILSAQSLSAIKRFPLKPAAFIFWGYTEPDSVRRYAQANNIKIYRMEDGFIRSSSLGASHSTPYSLVLDTKGLHYNPEETSDIEEILNNHTFSEQELASAKTCMDLMQDLALSKYNPPSLNTDNQAVIKIRKRVVVLGQVDDDMSIRLGNPDRWSMIELIRLAKLENPDADILYRPHPDIYQGYQTSKFRKRAVEKICELASPEIPLSEFLDTVDHVYTITSLSGLEALLKGKKVTVVGAAFYAGWGLTDDRIKFPRRTAKRTLLELYAGVYLKYPRYLADLEDSEIGFQAAALRIKADHEIERFNLYKSQKTDTAENIQALAQSDYWPHLLFKKQTLENEKLVQESISKIDFKGMLNGHSGRIFQIFFVYSLCGNCKSNSSRDTLISSIRSHIDFDILNALLLDLNKRYCGEYIASQFAWLLAEANETNVSLNILTQEFFRSKKASSRTAKEEIKYADSEHIGSKTNTYENSPFYAGCEIDSDRITIDQAKLLLEILDKNVSLKRFDEALRIAKDLLLEGYFTSQIAQKLASIAVIKFDYSSVKNIGIFCQRINLYESRSLMALYEAKGFTENHVKNNSLGFIQTLVKLIVLRPDNVVGATFLAKSFASILDVKHWDKVFKSVLSLDNEQSPTKAAAFNSIERPLLAVQIVENLIKQGSHSEYISYAYSQALSFAGRLDAAIAVMDNARKLTKNSRTYCETIRLYIRAGWYDRALMLVKDAQERKLELGDMYPRKVYSGSRMIKEALETYGQMLAKKNLATYYPEKYFHFGAPACKNDNLIALAVFGPGDEIRFASIYNLLPGKLIQKNVSISCDPRLHNIFTRSFSWLNFIPVQRWRNGDPLDLKNYTEVLGFDLIPFINNALTKEINNSDGVMLVTDMLHECLPSYEAFPGTPYLKHDESLSRYYRNQLPQNTNLVGLSWRSSLTTHSRNEHYLTVEELEPIFKIDGVQFVNFQYDECQEELDWIEKRYPGKVINIAEIDHYNDFDSVAALMKCMDLIIAPATTVVELAGALGCPTWLLSNSSELHWRKIDQRGTDVWHSSIAHIEGTVLGDKSTLVERLCESLSEFANQDAWLRQSA